MAVVGDHVGVAWVSDSMEPKQGRLLGRSSRPSPGRSVDEAVIIIVDVAVDHNIGVVADMAMWRSTTTSVWWLTWMPMCGWVSGRWW
jgi:hypothetical protein